MEETILQLAEDITSLKWMLGVISVLLLIVAAMLIFAFRMLIQAVRNTESRAESRMFRDQAETLLEAGNNSELRELAEERVRTCHSDAWAHYYLGMALYRQRDPFLAKQHFDRVVKLDPLLKSTAEECLAGVNEMLSEIKLKPVK